MLIELDEKLKDYFNEGIYSEDDVRALDNIVYSHRMGLHFVFAQKVTIFNDLRMIADLNKESKILLNVLKEQITTLFQISKMVKNKIVVIPPISNNQKFSRVDNKEYETILGETTYDTIFNVPLNYFNDAGILGKSRFITENIEDGKIYKFIAEHYMDKQLAKLINISLDILNGGGNEARTVLEEKVDERCISFTVVDSDRTGPNMELGTVSQQVNNVYQHHKDSWIMGLEILPVREKENLFSTNFYRMFSSNPILKTLDQLEKIEKSSYKNNILPYHNYKNGLIIKTYKSHHSDIFKIPGLLNIEADIELELSNNSGCKLKQDKNSQKKILIEPLGRKALVIENLTKVYKGKGTEAEILEKRVILNNLDTTLLDYQKKYLEILSKKIIDWGFSNKNKTI